MSHTEFDAVDGKYPQVSDFGRVLLWDGPMRGQRYEPAPRVDEEYSTVHINGVSFQTASLVLNAFDGAPEDGQTAVSLRSPSLRGLWPQPSCQHLRSTHHRRCLALQDHITSTDKGNNRWSKKKGRKEFGNLQWAAATCEAADAALFSRRE